MLVPGSVRGSLHACVSVVKLSSVRVREGVFELQQTDMKPAVTPLLSQMANGQGLARERERERERERGEKTE